MNAPGQTYRAGGCLAAAFAVRWSWRSTFPPFGPGTITPKQAVARMAPRMRPISAVGANAPAWRRADAASLASRMRRRGRPEASVPGAARRCSTSARARRIWSISRGRSSPAVPAASHAITWPSRSFRIGPTQANGLSPSRAIPGSSGNARNRAGARGTLMTLVPQTLGRSALRAMRRHPSDRWRAAPSGRARRMEKTNSGWRRW